MNKYSLRCLASARMSELFSASVFANDLKFHGYIGQGIISSEDNLFYVSETGIHFDYREIGLNSSWQISDELRATGQSLSRKTGDLDDGDPRIDFLLLNYSFSVTDDNTSGVRRGQVKNPYGIYNTSRDVPHARAGVFVPQSFYGEAYRDTLLSSQYHLHNWVLTSEYLSIGARCYFTPNLSLTGEYSRNHGTAYINSSDSIDYSQVQKNWDYLVFQLSYHFELPICISV